MSGRPSATDIGSLIATLRRDASLSQQALADRLGTSQPAVSRWERGHDEPRLSTLEEIVAACGRRLTLAITDLAIDDGIDRAQIRQQLAMTPDERLQSVVNVSAAMATARPVG